MNIGDARKLYVYTDWANDRILAAIAELSEEQFTRQIISSYPSIRETLSHIASAEWLWLQRWMGESPVEFPEWTKTPSFNMLSDQIHRTAADRRAYLTKLAGDRIDSTVLYRSTRGDRFAMVLGELFIHCANHSTYHRGQLVTMLRQVSVTPPNTDYTQFVRS